ncbi:MAG TPA: SWIM zinc finger family protein, partial [Geminicoccaceae bacterium]|nr:SWIM zinc finger family protein [Geminicoccaceae bacterium]
MLRYGFDDLERLLGAGTLDKGQTYLRRGRVRDCRVEADARSVSGRIVGTAPRPYRATVRLGFVDGRLARIDGACSCPVGYNCKHVAALLLAAVAEDAPRATAGTAAYPPQPADAPLALWLRALEQAGDGATGPEEPPERVLYVLEPAQRYWQDVGVAQPVAVRALKVRRLKAGGYGGRQNQSFAALAGTPPARHVRPEDQVIGRLLHHRYGHLDPGTRLRGRADIEALRAMLATGRCHWRDVDGPPLREGPAREGRFAWTFEEDGRQTLVCRMADGRDDDAVILALTPPWYLDPEGGVCGPLETAVPPALAASLLSLPPVPPEAVEAVRAALDRRPALAEVALPRPRPIGGAERRRVAPRPVLSLDCPAVPVRPVSPWDPSPPAVRLPLAGLSFDYDGKRIAWTDRRAEIVRFDGARLEVLPRDRAAERRAVRRLRRLDLIRLGDG